MLPRFPHTGSTTVSALACALASTFLVVGSAAAAQRAGEDDATEAGTLPRELEGIGIVDKPGAQVPGDIVLTDQEGRTVKTAELFAGDKPTVLVLAYYSCPMLCTLVLNGLNDGLKSLHWKLGEDYRVVAVSIDERDTPAIAKEKRANYLKDYGRETTPDAWPFLTGTSAEVKRLADAVGFSYRWEEETQQFAHAAGAFVLTPGGKLSRTLYGIVFAERDLRLALVEAGEGLVGNAMDRLLLFCFHYDPQARGYVLAATRVMKASAFLTVLVMALFLGTMWRRERAAMLKVKEA